LSGKMKMRISPEAAVLSKMAAQSEEINFLIIFH